MKNKYMYINCEVGEDAEGEACIWSIHSVSDKPMYRVFDGHIEDTRVLMFDTAPPIYVSFKRPYIVNDGPVSLGEVSCKGVNKSNKNKKETWISTFMDRHGGW